MNFEYYFLKQINRHPSMQYQDAVKLCYQAAFGAEHILSNLECAYTYLVAEFDAVSPTDEPIYEQISPCVARVNLGAWKREGHLAETLFDLFKSSAFVIENSNEKFVDFLDIAEGVLSEKMPEFDRIAWVTFLENHKKAGMPPVHHSDFYRENENPHYRIVKISELEKIL